MKFRLFAIIILCFAAACFSLPKNENVPAPAETPAEASTLSIDLTKPLVISNLPEDVSLCEKINLIIDRSEFQHARWGIIVISLKDSRVLCAREAQKLFNPASIQKLLTSLVALEKLGAEFRWKTFIYTTQKPEGAVLDGDLILYGTGAPDFTESSLDKLVKDLKDKGLQQIKGNIIADESFFKGDKIGDGWTWNELQWYYGAEASAITFNNNQAEITINNGKPVSSTAYVQTTGTVKPLQEVEAVGLKREINENLVYAWGSGRALQATVSVSRPALWAAKVFKEKLEKSGIRVEGEVRFTDWKSDNKFAPAKAFELTSIESATLGEIIRKMNKDSVNLYAELILRTLGKNFGETAPDENPKLQQTRGDDSAGAAVIKKWLLENDISTDDIKIHDGSGLSRLDFVTPETIGRTLIFASQSKFADLFKDSLPIAGTDGTLRGRLPNLRGRVLAKTGSITYVNALAGYLRKDKETLAFAIITNNETRKNDSSPMIDELAATLAN